MKYFTFLVFVMHLNAAENYIRQLDQTLVSPKVPRQRSMSLPVTNHERLGPIPKL